MNLIVTDVGPREVIRWGVGMICFAKLITTYRVSDGYVFINVPVNVEGFATNCPDAEARAEHQGQAEARMAWANHHITQPHA